MARKLGFASRLVPRFGLLWIFAAMLLCISGAGWWKFHRDLYVEERVVVEALKASGGKVACHHRDFGYFVGSSEEEGTDVPWDAPFQKPILMIVVEGAPSSAARDAALRLPRLKAYSETRPRHRVPPFRPDDWRGIEAFLGRELPALPDATLELALLDEPLPEGEPVTASETQRVSAEIYAGWRNPEAIPPRRLVVSETTYVAASPSVVEHPLRVDLFAPGCVLRYARNPRYGGSESVFQKLDDGLYGYKREASVRWRRQSRRDNLDAPLFRRFPDDDFPYMAPDFDSNGIVVSWIREGAPSFEFRRIARIDEVRYRIDFAPFEVPYDPSLDIGFGPPPTIQEWSCVLRSDLDWVPERSRLVQTQSFPGQPASRSERRLVQRFTREGKYVTLSERLSSGRTGSATAPRSPEVLHARYVTELDPAYHERAFNPLALDPDPWPAPRELPWLPWHRTTFVLGCALGLFLVGRKLMPREKSPVSADPEMAGDGESPPTD
ncbi:MAG TPA: hypothetical protein VGN57_19480 [Pirellulaceae bacterium]|jgi:hypothetical protein|nr:hypothetical protein [Pirellulaceae bacterium]